MLLAAPQWMLDQIACDLAPFQDGIDEATLNSLMDEELSLRDLLFRFKITNNNISVTTHPDYVKHPRMKAFQSYLRRLASKKSLSDVDFVVSMHDALLNNDNKNPIFVFSKNKNLEGAILIPDLYALIGYDKLTKKVQKGVQVWPWERKKEIAFWRGATTGGDYNINDWKNMPRTQLVTLSRDHPALIDAKFVGFHQGADKNPEMLEESSWLLGKKVSEADSLRYKYLVDIDGNSCGWNRLYWTLLSNSVVFKQQSDNIEWYYGILVPYRHFIPIANDCSDLIDQMAWAHVHDDECREIAENATEFALENLNPNAIDEYFYLLLLEYAKLIKQE